MEKSELNIPELFGKNVQKYRKQAKLTQAELSERLDITQKHLSIIETGSQFASAHLIARLCEELHVSPAALFGEDINQNYMDMLYLRMAAHFENKMNQVMAVLSGKINELERKLNPEKDSLSNFF